MLRAPIRVAVFALVALALAVAAPARASDMDQYGLGARPISLGNAMTAVATDWTAAYYNPAGLALGRTPTVGAGFSYADDHLDYDAETVDPAVERRAERVGPLSAITGGVSATLGAPGSLLNRVGLGFAAFVPTRHILSLDVETAPGEPEFFLYGARRDRLTMVPAIAFRIPLGDLEKTQSLAIGVAANVLANASGQQTFNLGPTPSSAVTARIDADYTMAPNFGVFYWPLPWLSVGVAYRGEISLGADIDVSIDLTGSGTAAIPLDLRFVSLFQPQQVQAGIALDPLEGLTVALDVTWNDWSSFEDPFITVGTVIGQVPPNFHDTVVPRVGVEVEPLESLALRLGYFFEPSPIPKQRGELNLADADKHVLAFGAGYTYWTTRDAGVREGGAAGEAPEPYAPVSIDVFFQWHHLVGERVAKDDPANSGGVGSFYEASGEVFNVGVTFTFRL